MQKIILRLAFLFLLFPAAAGSFAQDHAFHDEIMAFKAQDSITPPAAAPILFTGSSSFRIWKEVQAAFPGYGIINRGFGGSIITDVTFYAEDVIFPYKPRQIVLYCGDNDLAASDTVTAEVVFSRFKELFSLIRGRMEKVPILYVAIKPSPSRERLMPRIVEANRLIADFLRGQSHVAFVDIYHPMLTPDGRPRPELFQEDMLHMNAKGYAIWRKVIRPYLKKHRATSY